MDKPSFNKGMVEAIEGATTVIDFAIREGYDLAWVKVMLQLGVAGLDTRQPVNAKEAGQSMRDILRKISNGGN